MKRILVISHIFPPDARAGAHRAYAMANHLPENGWEPIFVAPQLDLVNRQGRLDRELLRPFSELKIHRVRHSRPFATSDGVMARGTRKAYGWMLPPDRGIVWNMRLKRSLDKIITLHKPQVALMTAPPFSTLLLGGYLKREYGLKIVLDYRDAWTNNPGIQCTLPRRVVGPYLDKRALAAADLVTTASYEMARFIQESVGPVARGKRFLGFPYGFDSQFFAKEAANRTPPTNGTIRATFAGKVHGQIDVEEILSGIRDAIDESRTVSDRLRIECYGTLFGHTANPQDLIAEHGLDAHVSIHPFLPYRSFVESLSNSSFLILPLGEFDIAHIFYPTKMFDFLGVGRPIVYIGGSGGLQDAIEDCNAGLCTRPNRKGIARAIVEMAGGYDEQGRWYTNLEAYSRFERLRIYRQFCAELDQLVAAQIAT